MSICPELWVLFFSCFVCWKLNAIILLHLIYLKCNVLDKTCLFFFLIRIVSYDKPWEKKDFIGFNLIIQIHFFLCTFLYGFCAFYGQDRERETASWVVEERE